MQSINLISALEDSCNNWKLETVEDGKLRSFTTSIQTCDQLMLNRKELKVMNTKMILTEYSVIYSESYEVPVMYFCLSDQGMCYLCNSISFIIVPLNSLTMNLPRWLTSRYRANVEEL